MDGAEGAAGPQLAWGGQTPTRPGVIEASQSFRGF